MKVQIIPLEIDLDINLKKVPNLVEKMPIRICKLPRRRTSWLLNRHEPLLNKFVVTRTGVQDFSLQLVQGLLNNPFNVVPSDSES
tara:strand:- start:349 stop:603 length:255 start_codon:yes stop_codon:yes gene_type:complete